MTDDRFIRAHQLTEHAFATALQDPTDVSSTVNDLTRMAVGDMPAIAIARARLAAHMAHRSTAAVARLAVSMLDSAEELLFDGDGIAARRLAVLSYQRTGRLTASSS